MISPVETWVAEKTGLKEKLNAETLQCWQLEKLQDLLEYVSRVSAYYKGKIRTGCRLEKLPFTTPSELVRDPLSFLCIPQREVARVTTLSNSGTTRERKRIFFSKKDLQNTKDFFEAGMKTMTSRGDHACILISNRTENSLGSLLRESLMQIGVTAHIPGIIKSAADAIATARNADCIIGMPAELLYMSRIDQSLRPKSVLLAADIAPQVVINSIRETWRCEVYTHYGHTEFGYGCAVDCTSHNGLHLRHADNIFEVINPATLLPVLHWQTGEIVITTLANEAMPLIRYRTGQLTHLNNSPCKCGSTLPRFEKIIGRLYDIIILSNGASINIHTLDELLFLNPNVKSYKPTFIKENNAEKLHLLVDSVGKIDTHKLAANLPKCLSLGITYGSYDPFTNRGKRRLHSA
ncbi:MAG TPA: hypothetical protein PKN41_12315 [Bacteroidales bacterium]|nr:hypothetical protein [Bacteroidales bacterium]